MILSLLNFQSIVSQSAAAVQAKATKLLNMTVGSVTRSILEASASVGLWVQYLIVQVWLGTRLATSTGTDVDSFVGDFSLTRLAAVPATGLVTFARASTSTSALVVPYFNADGSVNTAGTTVLTGDLVNTYGVSVDTANAAWNTPLAGYLMNVGVDSATLPVASLSSGASGNIQAGTIALLGNAVPFVDTVTNPAPFENGQDQESDTALKGRFVNYINTRSRATPAAVDYAVSTVQPGITFDVLENTDASGAYRPGNFVVYIDDGTGSPPSTLISAVYSAVDAVRPIGSTFTVLGPTIVNVTVSLSITVGSSGNKAVAQGEVKNAILDYIDALPVGSALAYSKLAALAWGADPTITNVLQLLLNGGTADVTAANGQVIKATQVVVN